MPCKQKIGECCFITFKVIFQKEAIKVFWRLERVILCHTTIHSHQQEWFDDHMNPQRPHNRGLSHTTSKCSFLKHIRPPKSLLMWPTYCGSQIQVSWTIFRLPHMFMEFPTHRVCCIVAATPWACPLCMTEHICPTTIRRHKFEWWATTLMHFRWWYMCNN